MQCSHLVVNLRVNVVVDNLLEREGLGSVTDTVVQHTGSGSSLLGTGTALSVLPHTTGLANVCGTCDCAMQLGG